mmetsp:Transcript_17323/g.37586  ORF Transcript_17323/g.37586 Transcript_17323/m.37586 type:complete len:462 (+) Transcript_17323:1-1386(+)
MVFAHMLWFLERRPDNQGFSMDYGRGLFQCVWMTVVTVTTVGFGDKTPRRFIGRLVMMAWMVIGLVLYGVFLGTLSSNLTLSTLSRTIDGLSDIANWRVGVERNAFADIRSRAVLKKSIKYQTPAGVFEGLVGREVDAIVMDMPAITFAIQNETYGGNKLIPVAKEFATNRCGIFGGKHVGSWVWVDLNNAIASVMYGGRKNKYLDVRAKHIPTIAPVKDFDWAYRSYVFATGYIFLSFLLLTLFLGALDKAVRTYRDHEHLIAAKHFPENNTKRLTSSSFNTALVKHTIRDLVRSARVGLATYLRPNRPNPDAAELCSMVAMRPLSPVKEKPLTDEQRLQNVERQMDLLLQALQSAVGDAPPYPQTHLPEPKPLPASERLAWPREHYTHPQAHDGNGYDGNGYGNGHANGLDAELGGERTPPSPPRYFGYEEDDLPPPPPPRNRGAAAWQGGQVEETVLC